MSGGNYQTMAISAIASAIADLAAAQNRMADKGDLERAVGTLIGLVLAWREGQDYDSDVDEILTSMGVNLNDN